MPGTIPGGTGGYLAEDTTVVVFAKDELAPASTGESERESALMAASTHLPRPELNILSSFKLPTDL